MTVHACRTTFGNYINCMRCASRLLDAHTHTRSSSRDYVSSSFTNFSAKLPWPGDSEMTIRSSSRCHMPPISTTPRLNLHAVPLMLNVKKRSCEYQFLKSFRMTRQENKFRSGNCKANSLTTTPKKMTALCIKVSTCFIRVKILLIKVTVTVTITSYFFKSVAAR